MGRRGYIKTLGCGNQPRTLVWLHCWKRRRERLPGARPNACFTLNVSSTDWLELEEDSLFSLLQRCLTFSLRKILVWVNAKVNIIALFWLLFWLSLLLLLPASLWSCWEPVFLSFQQIPIINNKHIRTFFLPNCLAMVPLWTYTQYTQRWSDLRVNLPSAEFL